MMLSYNVCCYYYENNVNSYNVLNVKHAKKNTQVVKCTYLKIRIAQINSLLNPLLIFSFWRLSIVPNNNINKKKIFVIF